MKLIKHKRRAPGSGVLLEEEEILTDIKFNKFKFSDKLVPQDKNKILFITCFGEFGCESLGLMYCIPKIVKNNSYYTICVGWHGRDYLYKHLVDEFWAVKEEYQWLREYSMAFKNTSKNISKLEKELESLGRLYRGHSMGMFCLGNTCKNCNNFWGDNKYNCSCPKCGSKNIDWGLLNDVQGNKKNAVKIPLPSKESLGYIDKYLKPNSVGVFARNRVCYGRNLSRNFYIDLIDFLRLEGYNPIWLGEKQSVLPCPVNDVTDFSATEDASNLELTLALISKLEFTVQFWTASTRLASMVDTPWILFESPDQIVGLGQEGIRIALTSDFNKKKLVLAHYKNIAENEDTAFPYLKQSIQEMKEDNWQDIIGPVDNPETISLMLQKQDSWR
jgi:predicted Zn-ribbon and HTH transcriptional regulator